MTQDGVLWEDGRTFLVELVASNDPDDKEIVRLLTELVSDWQPAIGLLIGAGEPLVYKTFMYLIERNEKKRVITELRTRLHRKKEEEKREKRRIRKQLTAAFAVRDDSPIDR